MQTWHDVVVLSRHKQRRPEKLGRRQSMIMYDGRSVMKPKFHLACLDSTRHDSTRSTCRAHAFWLYRASRTAQLDSLDTTSSTGATCNLVMIIVIHVLLNLSYSLIYWSIHLFNLFHVAEQIGFVCVRKNKNTCKTFKSYRCCELFYVCCEIQFNLWSEIINNNIWYRAWLKSSSNSSMSMRM